MHDEPEASEQEQEQAGERLEEEDAMRAQGHDDPEHFKGDEEDEEE
jgi:hypothetical protein